MKIIASSVLETADSFLHAGYISAYARPLDSMRTPYSSYSAYWTSSGDAGAGQAPGQPQLTLDVAEALRLEGETLTHEAAVAPSPTSAATIGAFPNAFFTTGAVAFFVVALGLAYAAKQLRWRRPLQALPSLVACVLIGAGALAYVLLGAGTAAPYAELPPPTASPPWEGAQTRAYADPEQATLALLHGVIADALVSVPGPVESLVQLQEEVGLPAQELTEGERYALQTYGLDGWGRPFRLTSHGMDNLAQWYESFRGYRGKSYRAEAAPGIHAEARYVVTSAGPDGVFDNADDLKVAVKAPTEYNWDECRHAFFLRKEGEAYVVLFHRWSGELFAYVDKDRAALLSGSDLYDAFPLTDDMRDRVNDLERVSESVRRAYDAVAAERPYRPLVLQVYARPKEGAA